MPAVALTDRSNLFALVKFYRAAIQNGIKPIIGTDVLIAGDEEADGVAVLTLLCMNREGYLNLSRLLTQAYVGGQQGGLPTLKLSDLTEDSCSGLIALSGAAFGDIGHSLLSNRHDVARQQLDHWCSVFPGRFYLELQRCGRENDEACVHASVALAAESNTPVVATNDVRFLRPTDFQAHEVRVCIHDGYTLADPARPRRYTKQQYLKTPEEMAELFDDVPEALENTLQIAARCTLELTLGKSVLPDFPVPDGHTPETYLQVVSKQELDKRVPEGSEQVYNERLTTELKTIINMGFAGYFLIVADFIRWARENDIPVGPGRGSGAGSLVAFVLGITDLDPIEHELLFERFLNPERVSMPDFDIDFCMEGRDRVIDYVAQRYGKDRVSQIITFGTMAAKAVVRDVGRVLGHPYGFCDRIAKLIPFEIGITLDKALKDDKELLQLYEDEEDVRGLIDLARPLEGLVRNAGKHAGGVVIAPSGLTDFTPLYCEPGGDQSVTQLDKDDVEAAGLVKFDFLGLRTLTVIDWALETINSKRLSKQQEPIDIGKIPMDDGECYKLLQACETTAVFQLESRGMKDLIKRLRPDVFDEIVALVALFRPGPLQSGMVDDFIQRKHDKTATVDYLHPSLEHILKPTYGVILYQEQVMQIAQVLSGYTLGGADLLRRAMGKKKPEEMAKQRSVFLDGAEKNGVEVRVAARIFDIIEKFAGYGFNKSHSAAYAILSYQTAWLKTHYPAAFMAAVLSADMDHTDKVVTLIDECKSMGLEVLSPDVNHSQYKFTVSGDRSIRYGLGAIKGVGHGAIECVTENRKEQGPFVGLGELCGRVDLHKSNRRVLEALIKAGALDSLGENRATLMYGLGDAIRNAEQKARASEAGQSDLFGLSTDIKDERYPPLVPQPDWNESYLLAAERETLGLFLSGHPIAEFEQDLSNFVSARIGTLISEQPESSQGKSFGRGGREVVVAGLVLDVKKRGNRASLTLDDHTGRIEVNLFEETYNNYRHIIAKDSVIAVEGNLGFDEFIGGWRVTARRMSDVDTVREKNAQGIVIQWSESEQNQDLVSSLQETLGPFRNGQCGIAVQYQRGDAEVMMRFDESWSVKPTRELLRRLTDMVGRDRVRIRYKQNQNGGLSL
ncbi:MAG: DNA polymerase III subunit alpha [Pseudomonadota bacterium]